MNNREPKHKLALQKIREQFQRFPLHFPHLTPRWTLIPGEVHDLLAHALIYLCDSLKIERAAVFLFDENTQTLLARQLVDRGDVMAGEEEIAVLPGSQLGQLVSGQLDHLIIAGNDTTTSYIPLRAFGNVFGVLRAETGGRSRKLPGATLSLLKDFAHEQIGRASCRERV